MAKILKLKTNLVKIFQN